MPLKKATDTASIGVDVQRDEIAQVRGGGRETPLARILHLDVLEAILLVLPNLIPPGFASLLSGLAADGVPDLVDPIPGDPANLLESEFEEVIGRVGDFREFADRAVDVAISHVMGLLEVLRKSL